MDSARLGIRADGGDVELVDVSDDGTVTVRLMGMCVGCPLSELTMSNGIEQLLREKVPGVTRVVAAE